MISIKDLNDQVQVYTKNISNLEKALAGGVLSVDIGGQTTTYKGNNDLKSALNYFETKLRKLNAQLNGSSGSRFRTFQVTTSKGF